MEDENEGGERERLSPLRTGDARLQVRGEFEEVSEVECEDAIALVIFSATKLESIVDDAATPSGRGRMLKDLLVILELQGDGVTVAEHCFLKELHCLGGMDHRNQRKFGEGAKRFGQSVSREAAFLLARENGMERGDRGGVVGMVTDGERDEDRGIEVDLQN
jgi:hypothetical protein